MASSHFQQLLFDATSPALDTDVPLGPNGPFRLYTSGCRLQGIRPKPSLSRAGMRRCHLSGHAGRWKVKVRAGADCMLSFNRHAA